MKARLLSEQWQEDIEHRLNRFSVLLFIFSVFCSFFLQLDDMNAEPQEDDFFDDVQEEEKIEEEKKEEEKPEEKEEGEHKQGENGEENKEEKEEEKEDGKESEEKKQEMDVDEEEPERSVRARVGEADQSADGLVDMSNINMPASASKAAANQEHQPMEMEEEEKEPNAVGNDEKKEANDVEMEEEPAGDENDASADIPSPKVKRAPAKKRAPARRRVEVGDEETILSGAQMRNQVGVLMGVDIVADDHIVHQCS